MKIAIIGSEGFVGNACCHIFRQFFPIKIDPRINTHISDYHGQEIDMFLICAPTPMGKDGKIDCSIIDRIMDQLAPFYGKSVIVLKSTVLPNIVHNYWLNTPKFVYNPEFLTEKNAKHEAEHPFMTVLGGDIKDTQYVENVYRKFSICREAPFYHTGVKEASFIKYGVNSFLATKVLFWNQFYEMCESNGADYELIKAAIGTDKRISSSHMNVPGHDGRMGAAGACFSKDIPALIHFSNKEFTILKEAWNYNCDVRNSYGECQQREKEQHVVFAKIED